MEAAYFQVTLKTRLGRPTDPRARAALRGEDADTRRPLTAARPQPGTLHQRRHPLASKTGFASGHRRGNHRSHWRNVGPRQPPPVVTRHFPRPPPEPHHGWGAERRRSGSPQDSAGRRKAGWAGPLFRLTGLWPPPRAGPHPTILLLRRAAPPSVPRDARLPGSHFAWGRKARSRTCRCGRYGRLFWPLGCSSVTESRCGPSRLFAGLT